MTFARRIDAALRFALTTALVWGAVMAVVGFVLALVVGMKGNAGSLLSAAYLGASFGVGALIVAFVGGLLGALLLSCTTRFSDGREVSPWWAGGLGLFTGFALVCGVTLIATVLSGWTWSQTGVQSTVQFALGAGVFGAITGATFAGVSRRGALPPAPGVPMIDQGDA